MIDSYFRWNSYRELSAAERDVFDFMLDESRNNVFDKGQSHIAECLDIHIGSVKNAFRKLQTMEAIVVSSRISRRGFERVFINPKRGMSRSADAKEMIEERFLMEKEMRLR